MEYKEVLSRMKTYCSYRERCHQEVRNKLYALEVRAWWIDRILADLIEDDFLNEQRYAKFFCSGKFRMNNWGKIKIVSELRRNRVSQRCIEKGIEVIDQEEYLATLKKLLTKKWESLSSSSVTERKKKAAFYGIQKGYEAHLVWEEINIMSE